MEAMLSRGDGLIYKELFNDNLTVCKTNPKSRRRDDDTRPPLILPFGNPSKAASGGLHLEDGIPYQFILLSPPSQMPMPLRLN